ncbi:hypothetical protein QFZ22_005699 [Streptomyces canus]|uniref:Uncharacterized protein n=1 Tax=Streptomyces canus TaxID=58343 RepID=A0AAW8FIT8_9ACTN|nr:hypothetical protein [Streptomyces canus]
MAATLSGTTVSERGQARRLARRRPSHPGRRRAGADRFRRRGEVVPGDRPADRVPGGRPRRGPDPDEPERPGGPRRRAAGPGRHRGGHQHLLHDRLAGPERRRSAGRGAARGEHRRACRAEGRTGGAGQRLHRSSGGVPHGWAGEGRGGGRARRDAGRRERRRHPGGADRRRGPGRQRLRHPRGPGQRAALWPDITSRAPQETCGSSLFDSTSRGHVRPKAAPTSDPVPPRPRPPAPAPTPSPVPGAAGTGPLGSRRSPAGPAAGASA